MAILSSESIDAILKKNNASTQKDIDETSVSLDSIDSFGDNESLKECFTDIAKYNSMINEKITFINSSLTTAIPFTRENLYLICAYSGSGKSTIAANISYPLWKQGKKTLIISNEEPKQDILFRIACLELGYNFNDYKKGKMPLELQKDVVKLFPEISKYAKIIDVNYNGGLSMKIEGIKNALTSVQDADYSCAMLDYYQLIRYSIEKPQASTYEVLNDLRIWLGRYIKNSKVPIVIFAQLHSLGKRNNKDLDSRIKHSPEIYETATVVLEVIPDFENQTSDFIIKKDRFGYAGQRVVCKFDKGKFIDMDRETILRMIDDKVSNLEKIVEVE